MDGKLTRQLKRIMKESGLSQYAMARDSGLSKAALSRFVSGKRGLTLRAADKLAGVLGLDLVSRRPGRKG